MCETPASGNSVGKGEIITTVRCRGARPCASSDTNAWMMKNILIFSFSFIGDAVLSTVVIQPLKKRFPEAKLTFLVGPNAKGVLAGDIQIDDVWEYDNHGKHAGLAGKYRLIKALRPKKIDLVIDLRDSIWSRLLGIKRWGIALRGRELHAVTRYLDVLERHGVDTDGALPKLTFSEIEEKEVDDFLRRHKIDLNFPLIGIHPGGNWLYKLWDAENFAQLGSILMGDIQAQILLFAGPNEFELQEKVARMMKERPILVKECDLRRVAALISRCNFYIGNDTGPMHIATAVGTPVVAIFGSTDYRRSGPYGSQNTIVRSNTDLGCNPCHPGREPGGCGMESCQAMKLVTVEQVREAVENSILMRERAS